VPSFTTVTLSPDNRSVGLANVKDRLSAVAIILNADAISTVVIAVPIGQLAHSVIAIVALLKWSFTSIMYS
jgi:hypothetical protein